MEKKESDKHAIDQNASQNIMPRRNAGNFGNSVMFL